MEKPHTANEPILLLETDLAEIAGQSGEWPVRIILDLLPTPRLLLMLDDCPGIVFKDTPRSFEVSGRDLGSIEVIRPDSSRIYDQGNGTVTYRRTLTAKREPCVVVDDDEPLVSVDFSLFNFPKFSGLHYRLRWIKETGQVANGNRHHTDKHREDDNLTSVPLHVPFHIRQGPVIALPPVEGPSGPC